MTKKEKIIKLNINLFPESTNEDAYKQARAKFIAETQFYKFGGNFFSSRMENDPILAEAKWNQKFPDGYLDWKLHQRELNARGEQNVIDKINEIIDYLNQL